MRRAALAVAPLAVLALAPLAAGQGSAYQQQPQKGFRFTGDTLARYEWTRDVPSADGFANEDRYLLQIRPRLEVNVGPFELGVGGAFNYSNKENDLPPEGLPEPLLIRDNYRSRDARLDLAYGKLTMGPLIAQGGRFFMPITLTEMIWDDDLRPEGGAVTLRLTPQTSTSRFALHGIYATGSHVFEDQSVMFGGALELAFTSRQGGSFQLVGSYLQFQDLKKLQLALVRQNSATSLLLDDYKVVDVVARIGRGGQLPLQLIASYCRNTAVDVDNQGLWLAVVMGDLGVSRARAEYTYAKIDRDATVAAFNTDDFFWGTGFEGHRADLGSGTVKSSSIHAIAQWQRFKDSLDPALRDQWVTRYRLEWRTKF